MSWIVIVTYAGKVWTWVKANTGFLLLCVVGMFTGAKLLRRKDSQIATLNEAILAQKYKTEVAHLQGKAEELTKLDAASVVRDRVLAEDVTAIEREITERKKRLLGLHDKRVDPAAMTDAEVEERFRAAGL